MSHGSIANLPPNLSISSAFSVQNGETSRVRCAPDLQSHGELLKSAGRHKATISQDADFAAAISIALL
jgi:REP element-mobilizing transposase RayT